MLAAAARPGIAVLAGGTDPVDAVAFSPDGKILASGGGDPFFHRGVLSYGEIRLWDVVTHHQIGGTPHRPRRPGEVGGVQPGRQDAGQRQPR
jgi:WD40 repeat protein